MHHSQTHGFELAIRFPDDAPFRDVEADDAEGAFEDGARGVGVTSGADRERAPLGPNVYADVIRHGAFEERRDGVASAEAAS